MTVARRVASLARSALGVAHGVVLTLAVLASVVTPLAVAHAQKPVEGRDLPPAHRPARRTVRRLFVPAVSADFSRLRPGGRDAAFLTGTASVCAILIANDLELDHHIVAQDSQAKRDFASALKPFGNEVVLAGGVAAWGAAWLAGREPLFLRVQRADLSIASAGLCALAIKKCVGRKRPEESPNDASAFTPFSGHDAFPSGHATLAFAAAAALDRETTSRWVPAIAYPFAGLVGWSRLHDRKHWLGDVAAGAALGFGVAWKAEDVMRPRAGAAGALGATGARLELDALDGSLAAVRLRW